MPQLQLTILQWIESAERRSHEERINPYIYSEEIGRLITGGWVYLTGELSHARVDLTPKGRALLEKIRIYKSNNWIDCGRYGR